MYNSILITVNELWIKGKNQKNFFDLLIKHIRYRIGVFHKDRIEIDRDNFRIVVTSNSPFNNQAIEILTETPGIQTISLTRILPIDMKSLEDATIEEMNTLSPFPKTFKVVAKRPNKKFPIKSDDLCKLIGGVILRTFDGKIRAEMRTPETVVNIVVGEKSIYLSTKKISGMGGLPVGSADRLLTLISGGFDSPVASVMMSKRGAEQTFAFFYAYPFVGNAVKDKVIEIVKVISRYQRYAPLYIVPFGNIQKIIAEKSNAAYRTLIIRRAMIECSTLLAKKIGALGLITGDSLGQVSSQTVSSMAFLDKSTDLPIFRPLIGLNKEEILSLSRKYKTHDISIIPHDDACSLFAAKHPVLKPSEQFRDYYEKEINLTDALNEAIASSEVIRIGNQGEIINLPGLL